MLHILSFFQKMRKMIIWKLGIGLSKNSLLKLLRLNRSNVNFFLLLVISQLNPVLIIHLWLFMSFKFLTFNQRYSRIVMLYNVKTILNLPWWLKFRGIHDNINEKCKMCVIMLCFSAIYYVTSIAFTHKLVWEHSISQQGTFKMKNIPFS